MKQWAPLPEQNQVNDVIFQRLRMASGTAQHSNNPKLLNELVRASIAPILHSEKPIETRRHLIVDLATRLNTIGAWAAAGAVLDYTLQHKDFADDQSIKAQRQALPTSNPEPTDKRR